MPKYNQGTLYCDLHTYGRVQTGNASRYQSERTFNDPVCPVVLQQDILGRTADYNSLITTTYGCNSASERIDVEDALRPGLYDNAQLSGAGVEMGGDSRDLQLVNRLIQMQTLVANGNILPDTKALYSQTLRDCQWEAIGQKVQYFKHLSGMQ
jgi:hypothetical protein